MKLKQLEMLLERIQGFENPKIQLEQYETGPHIGARMLFAMNSYEDVAEKTILDLGTGCGRLGLACASLDASFVLGVDIDQDALNQCANNLLALRDDQEDPHHLSNFDIVCADVCDDNMWPRFDGFFDVVVMNPPFGTKNNKGIDMMFLQRALQLSNRTVYSLHKTSTRNHVLRKAEADWHVKAEVLAKLRYNLPKTYRFHRKQSQDIEVDFFRFEHRS